MHTYIHIHTLIPKPKRGVFILDVMMWSLKT